MLKFFTRSTHSPPPPAIPAPDPVKERFQKDMAMIQIASVIALIVGVAIPLITLCWITMLAHIPIALIVYDVYQIASTAKEHAGEPVDDIKPLVLQNTILLNLLFKIFSGFAEKAQTAIAKEITEMTGIRGRCSSSEKK